MKPGGVKFKMPKRRKEFISEEGEIKRIRQDHGLTLAEQRVLGLADASDTKVSVDATIKSIIDPNHWWRIENKNVGWTDDTGTGLHDLIVERLMRLCEDCGVKIEKLKPEENKKCDILDEKGEPMIEVTFCNAPKSSEKTENALMLKAAQIKKRKYPTVKWIVVGMRYPTDGGWKGRVLKVYDRKQMGRWKE